MVRIASRNLHTFAFVCLISWINPAGHASVATLYSLTDLGELTDLQEGGDSGPNDISEKGLVVGSNVTNGGYRAFLYDGAWTWLGTLEGSNTIASGVNDFGEVVGKSLLTNYGTHAFLWTPDGTNGVPGNPQMMDLGTLPGGINSEAAAINNARQITGYSETSRGDHAFLHSGGTMMDLGSFFPPNLPNSYGLDINEAGHVVGLAYDFFYISSHGFYYDGSTVVDIGTLHSNVQGTTAVAINDNNQIAGYGNTTNFYIHAFRYANGTMQDLGTLGGNYSYAFGINNSNVVVGGSYADAADSIYHAFVADGDSMINLNDVLDVTGNGWTLIEARAINDAGQIVGAGAVGTNKHGFLLTPVSSAPEITEINIIETNVLISFTTIDEAQYAVQSRNQLGNGGWSDQITGIPGNGGIVTATNWGGATQAEQYYRVYLSEP